MSVPGGDEFGQQGGTRFIGVVLGLADLVITEGDAGRCQLQMQVALQLAIHMPDDDAGGVNPFRAQQLYLLQRHRSGLGVGGDGRAGGVVGFRYGPEQLLRQRGDGIERG